MGNSSSTSTEETFGSTSGKKAIKVLSDLDPNTVPPSVNEVIASAKDLASWQLQSQDPLFLKRCQEVLLGHPENETNMAAYDRARRAIVQLSTFETSAPEYSEQTFIFRKDGEAEIHIMSTKNSDQTLSYWVQFPLASRAVHSALLKLLGVPVTPENLSHVCEYFPALCTQLDALSKHEVTKCEHVDPIFLSMVVKVLILLGYHVTYTSVKSP
jgi:hypothetical protein